MENIFEVLRGTKYYLEDAEQHIFLSDSKRKIICRSAENSAVLIAWTAITNSINETNVRTVICTDTKDNLSLLFKLIRALTSQTIKIERVVRDVGSPWQEIEFDNTSRIRGFSLGNKGIGLCGQDADYIHIDRAEQIHKEAILGAILPMLQTTPDTSISFYFAPSGDRSGPVYQIWDDNPRYTKYDLTDGTPQEDHTGMVWNPIDEEWRWL